MAIEVRLAFVYMSNSGEEEYELMFFDTESEQSSHRCRVLPNGEVELAFYGNEIIPAAKKAGA